MTQAPTSSESSLEKLVYFGYPHTLSLDQLAQQHWWGDLGRRIELSSSFDTPPPIATKLHPSTSLHQPVPNPRIRGVDKAGPLN